MISTTVFLHLIYLFFPVCYNGECQSGQAGAECADDQDCIGSLKCKVGGDIHGPGIVDQGNFCY